MNDGGLALRGTFLIDESQIIKSISINDLGVGRNVSESYRLLQVQIGRMSTERNDDILQESYANNISHGFHDEKHINIKYFR